MFLARPGSFLYAPPRQAPFLAGTGFAAGNCRAARLGWLAMSVATEAGGPPVPDDLPDVFGEFCAAGLWPGLGRSLAGQLAGAGITGPDLVSADRLALIEGVSGERAGRLAAAFAAARPCYETAQLLAACQVPARFAGPAVATLGRTAADQLRQDPWRLLALAQIRPDQADWFARKLLPETSPQDPRRGQALVSYLLGRAARDGHTAVPAGVIATALARFRVEDPAAAIAAAVDDGGVLPFEAGTGDGEPGEAEPDDADPGQADPGQADPAQADPAQAEADEELAAGVLLALARYAMAEESVAEGVQRLAALAEPVEPADAEPGGGPDPDAAPGPALTRRPGPARARTAPRPLIRPSGRPWRRSPRTGCPCSPAARAPARAARWRLWWRWRPATA